MGLTRLWQAQYITLLALRQPRNPPRLPQAWPHSAAAGAPARLTTADRAIYYGRAAL